MEREELLNIIYAERARLNSIINKPGWSIWIIIGCIITLSWKLFHIFISEHNIISLCETKHLFCDFISIAFAMLIFFNYVKNKSFTNRFDRFNLSKYPMFIFIDIIISITIIFYYYYINYVSPYNLLSIAIFFYLGMKIVELYNTIKIRQELSLLANQVQYVLLSIIIMICSLFNLYSHKDYYFRSTEFSIISCGICVCIYILLCLLYNNTNNVLSRIDDLIDRILINRNTNIDEVYEELISIKIGYKYSMLFYEKINNIEMLLSKIDNSIIALKKNLSEIENERIDNSLLINTHKLYKHSRIIFETSLSECQDLINSLRKGVNLIPKNQENINEIIKISDITTDLIRKIDLRIKEFDIASNSFNLILNTDKKNDCGSFCKYANNKVLCFIHRKILK